MLNHLFYGIILAMSDQKNLQFGPEAANDNAETLPGTAQTADDVMALLEGAAANDDKNIKVAGVKLTVSPQEALEKFKQALQIARDKLQKLGIEVDLDDVQFQKLEGNMAGESTERAALLDPALFRHPYYVIAEVMTHEETHQNESIPNEGLVQLIVEQLYGGSSNVQHEYAQMVDNFKVFVERCGVEALEIYKLYEAHNFEGIAKLYDKSYVSTLKTESEKDEAYDFYSKIFPELHYTEEGKTDIVDVDTDMLEVPAAA